MLRTITFSKLKVIQILLSYIGDSSDDVSLLHRCELRFVGGVVEIVIKDKEA